MTPNTDLYELLGVARHATDDEIKKAYRQKARSLHPDANPDDPTAEERFKEVSLAHEVLRDPEKRQRYDQFGLEGLRGTGAAGGGADAGGFGGLGDIFEAFFGGGSSPFGGGRRNGPASAPRGADLEAVLDLRFEEAVFGTNTSIDLRVPVRCDVCDGSGAAAGTSTVTCPLCQGAGEQRRVRQTLLGQMVTSSPCGRCGGLGKVVEKPCNTCRGEGRRTEARTVQVAVPAGVDNGMTLVDRGKGAAGPRGGPNGDLYLHARVAAHERFTREGYDLIEDLEIPLTKAALGSHVKYETLDGAEDLVIPSGTQNGRVFRLRHRGVPHGSDSRNRGDLLVRVCVITPTQLTKTQDELLRRLAEERGEEVAPPDKSLLGRIKSAFR